MPYLSYARFVSSLSSATYSKLVNLSRFDTHGPLFLVDTSVFNMHYPNACSTQFDSPSASGKTCSPTTHASGAGVLTAILIEHATMTALGLIDGLGAQKDRTQGYGVDRFHSSLPDAPRRTKYTECQDGFLVEAVRFSYSHLSWNDEL